MSNTKKIIGKSLFCVTDHHVVFEVIVISFNVIDSGDSDDALARIETKLAIENEYNGYHHEDYFQKMYTRNGIIDKGNVFSRINDANQFALNNITEEEENLVNKLSALRTKKASLTDDLNIQVTQAQE